MGSDDSKVQQLRVRVTSEERDLLEKLRLDRGEGETISDLVREGISMLIRPVPSATSAPLSTGTQERLDRLAALLRRAPQQVEEACVEGVLDLIDEKCEVPLIVMESHLHMKYRHREVRGGVLV